MKQTTIDDKANSHFDTSRQALEAAVSRGIRTPLSALRASLEKLSEDHQVADAELPIIDNALALVLGLGRSITELIDFALPPVHRPLPCSVEEIARTAVAALTTDQRRMITVAIEAGGTRFQVDGPIFSRALAGLLEAATHCGGEVLLRASFTEGAVCFHLFCSSEDSGSLCFLPRNSESLRLALAERELDRAGATLTRAHTVLGHEHFVVRYAQEKQDGDVA